MAWDPLVNYVASLSSDRTCHIYVKKPQSKGTGAEKANYVSEHVILKVEHPLSDDSKFAKNHLFLDETLPSFFRRLATLMDLFCLFQQKRKLQVTRREASSQARGHGH
ncbi:unnamed protein product [Malus baccata var. baccata]